MAQRIGIDVGGTNVKIALVSDKGKIIYSNSIPTRAEMGYEHTINSMKDAVRDLLKETKMKPTDIEGMGFGFPGQIDCKKGVVRLAPNIPGWVNIPIANIMEKEFSIPTRVDNDVRTATLGELNYGAGIGCENLVCITVGTGIGSGLVVNGKLVRGANNAAGEIGRPSIVALAEEYIRGGKSTKYRELANPDITPYIVAVAAKEGDPVARQIFRIMGEYIGMGLVSVVNLLNPEKIIIGGGVADAGDILFDPIKETIAKRAMTIQKEVQIVPAQLGNTAGVIGASLLIKA